MTFIGIISKKKSMCEIKRYIEKNLQQKHELIQINKDNIENVKNVTFETVLILDIEEIATKIEQLRNILKKSKYVLINVDIKEHMEILKDLDLNVITFGFNNKATMTASSVEQDNILICIQRNILDNKNNKIEPQEIKISVTKNKNIYEIMGIIGVLLIYNNKNMEKFYKI